MKVLTLLRHAKSGWDDAVERDFDRPLNRRGRSAARTVAREMRSQRLAFDLVLASPARRVVETIQEVAAEFGPVDPEFEDRAYLASTDTLLELIRTAPEAVERLLIVGHNPGIEQLALGLAKPGPLRETLDRKYPTATLAEIELPVERWSEVRPGIGALTRFIRPRDLDPELGPDPDEV